MSDPRLTYDSQTAQAISVSYSDLPADTGVVFVNEFGAETPSGVDLADAGSAEVPTTGMAPGQYYLSARASGSEVARTVKFYVAGGADNE